MAVNHPESVQENGGAGNGRYGNRRACRQRSEASVFQNSSACRGKGTMILGRVLRAPHMRSARENEDRP
jgi:hypothetical protein